MCFIHTVLSTAYNIGCCCLYSSEEQEQSQGKGNAEVEVDKVVELLYQLFSVKEEVQHMLHALVKSCHTYACLIVKL